MSKFFSPLYNNPGVSNENGSVEKSHDLLKNAIRQQLMLRGSSNFSNIDAYQTFINNLIASRNSSRIYRLTSVRYKEGIQII